MCVFMTPPTDRQTVSAWRWLMPECLSNSQDDMIDSMRTVANKKCAISHPRLNEGTCMREYSTIRKILRISFKSVLVSIVTWPERWVLTYASSFVKSWVRNCALFVRHTDSKSHGDAVVSYYQALKSVHSNYPFRMMICHSNPQDDSM